MRTVASGDDPRASTTGRRRPAAALAVWLAAACLPGPTAAREQPPAPVDMLPEDLIERGQFEDALQAGQRSLAAARQSGDPRQAAAALDTVGNAYFYLGDTARALEFFQLALVEVRALGDEVGAATQLKNVGIALLNLARSEEAVEYLRQALAIARELDEPALVASSLENIGLAYALLGAHQRAFELYEQAMAMAEEHRLWDQQHHVLVDMGRLLLDRGQPDRARARFEAALAVAEAEAQFIGQSEALDGLGQAHAALGDTQSAIATTRRCLALSRSLQHEDAATQCLWNLGYYHLQTDPERAWALLRESLAAAGRRDPDLYWWELSTLGTAARRLGRPDQAVDYYARAIDRLERQRDRIASAEYRASFLGRHHDTYTDLIELLLDRHRRRPDRGDDARAFHVFERSRARTIVEAVVQARTGAAGDRDPGQPSGAPARPAYPDPLTVEQAQATLGPSTALLAYSVSRRLATAFVLTARSFRTHELPVAPDVLAARVGSYMDLIAQDDAAGGEAISRRLYQELIAPLAPSIPPDVRQLVVVPTGVLHFLPFEALVSTPPDRPARYLVDDVAVSYAPSATVLAELAPPRTGSRRTAEADLVVFANAARDDLGAPAGATEAPFGVRALYDDEGLTLERLPFSIDEARAISAYAGDGSRVFLDAEASEHRIKRLPLDRYRVVHFAAHGLISQQAPSRSSLVVAPGDPGEDGFLEAREIYGLKLAADLVVLSGCQTARGQILAGDGVQSLARACLYAGAQAVLASLWNVGDRSTARFMEAFYGRLAAGESRAQALRSAKRQVVRDHPGLSPRHWAAFVLIGHPDGVIPLQGPGPGGARAGLALLALAGLAVLVGGRVLAGRGGALRRGATGG